MRQQLLVALHSFTLQGIDRSFHIDGVPQRDSCRQSAGAIALIFRFAVPDFPQSVQEGVRLGKGKYPTLRLFFNHQLLANCPSGGAMPFLRPKPSDYVHHATDLYESRQNQKRTV